MASPEDLVRDYESADTPLHFWSRGTQCCLACKQAIEADPTHGLPHVACCISMGRMALFSDNKGKVALAKTARDHAVIALEKAPQMDLAHHLMGRYVACCLRKAQKGRGRERGGGRGEATFCLEAFIVHNGLGCSSGMFAEPLAWSSS